MTITAYGKIESAVQAMRLGAIDYPEKPFRLVRLERQLREKFLSSGAKHLWRAFANAWGDNVKQTCAELY